jgi:hypothetical protein
MAPSKRLPLEVWQRTARVRFEALVIGLAPVAAKKTVGAFWASDGGLTKARAVIEGEVVFEYSMETV